MINYNLTYCAFKLRMHHHPRTREIRALSVPSPRVCIDCACESCSEGEGCTYVVAPAGAHHLWLRPVRAHHLEPSTAYMPCFLLWGGKDLSCSSTTAPAAAGPGARFCCRLAFHACTLGGPGTVHAHGGRSGGHQHAPYS